MHGHAFAGNLLFTLIFGALACLAFLLFFGIVGNRGSARFRNGRTEFPAGRASLATGLAIIGFLVESTVRHLIRSHSSFADCFIQGLLLIGAIAILSTMPGTILVTDEGLEQTYWLRKRIRLTWDDIVEVNLDKRIVAIRGDDGTRIVHTGQQVDRERLLVELKHHCGDELPPDFPNPPQS
jgi:hypothetical protein